MESYLNFAKESLIYPGEYIIPSEMESFLKDVTIPCSNSGVNPPIKMHRIKDGVRIELSLPSNISRQDIFLHVDYNILSLVIMHKSSEVMNAASKMVKIESNFLKHQIVLPKNADPEFVCAEFSLGILNIYIPINKRPAKTTVNSIVVY